MLSVAERAVDIGDQLSFFLWNIIFALLPSVLTVAAIEPLRS